MNPGTRADREGLDGFRYVTGEVPDESLDDALRAEEDRARREREAAERAVAELPPGPPEGPVPDDEDLVIPT